jgi:hypothetical protein
MDPGILPEKRKVKRSVPPAITKRPGGSTGGAFVMDESGLLAGQTPASTFPVEAG